MEVNSGAGQAAPITVTLNKISRVSREDGLVFNLIQGRTKWASVWANKDWVFKPYLMQNASPFLDKNIKNYCQTMRIYSSYPSVTEVYLLTLKLFLFFPAAQADDGQYTKHKNWTWAPSARRALKQDLMALWSDEGRSPVVEKPFEYAGH